MNSRRTMLGSVTFVLLAAICSPALIHGHGYLMYPEPRNLLHSSTKYNYPGGDGSGDASNDAVTNRILAGGYSFPDVYPAEGTHGLCGDPWRSAGIEEMPAIADQWMMEANDYTAWYREGGVIELNVAITANHRGFVEFRICDHNLNTSLDLQSAGQLCLDQNLLLRVDPFDVARNGECGTPANPVSPLENVDCAPVDPNYPGRFYVPDGSLLSTENSNRPYFTLKYKLPDGLTCESTARGNTCTLQWWWLTSNKCIPVGLQDWYETFYAWYNAYFPDGPSITAWSYRTSGNICGGSNQGQQFWNCADVVIVAKDSPAPPDPYYVGISPVSLRYGLEANDPTPSTDTVEDNWADACVARYGGCGSVESGFKCCRTAGDVCAKKDDYYYQCIEPNKCPPNANEVWDCTVMWPENQGWPDETAPKQETPAEATELADTTTEPLTTAVPDTPSTTLEAETSTPEPELDPTTSETQDVQTTMPEPEPAPTTSSEKQDKPRPTPTPEPDPEPTSSETQDEPTTTPEPEPSTPGIEGCFEEGYIGVYGNCTGQHSGCCGDGLLCFTLNDKYAQCRYPGTCPTCTWDCDILPAPCTTVIGKYGNCRTSQCCAEGLVCYEQDEGYAQCLSPGQCPACDMWTCTELIGGMYAPPSARRSLHPPIASAGDAAQIASADSAMNVLTDSTELNGAAPDSETALRSATHGVEAQAGSSVPEAAVAVDKVALTGSTLVLAAALVLAGKARSDLHRSHQRAGTPRQAAAPDAYSRMIYDTKAGR